MENTKQAMKSLQGMADKSLFSSNIYFSFSFQILHDYSFLLFVEGFYTLGKTIVFNVKSAL